MRSFQLLILVLFLGVYLIITLGSICSLRNILKSKSKNKLALLISLLTGVLLLCFIYLYIWPVSVREIKDYSVHLIFNAILSVDVMFKIPLTLSFLSGFLVSSKSREVMNYVGLIFSVANCCSVIYGNLLGRNELIVKKLNLEISELPENFDNIKIVQFSDTHLGNFIHSKKMVRKVGEEIEKVNPDIVLFTGDLINNFASELDGWDDVFYKITKHRICLSILGNHDYGNYSEWNSEAEKAGNFEKIIAAQNKLGFIMLNNENYKLKSGTDSIYFIGVENWGHPPFPQYANLEKALTGIPESAFKVVLSHDPAHWDEVIKNKNDIALTLSGHTHGLQWGIIKAGIPFSLSYFFRKNWGGLYVHNNSRLYVNSGIGTVGLLWRINMPAELTVLTLKRIKVD